MQKRERIEKSLMEFLALQEKTSSQPLESFLAQVEEDIRDEVAETCRLMGRLAPQAGVAPLSVPPSLGRLGPYLLEKEIGTGGMGSVFRAKQESLDRTVALKVIRVDRAHRAEFRDRFARESSLIAALDHPAIVQVIDRGEDGDQMYFVMEYIAGRSLRQWLLELQSGQALDPLTTNHESGKDHFGRGTRLLVDITAALVHAHGRGVFHRDLKPENIVMAPGDRPKIIDWGLASSRLEVSTLISMGIIGTAAYTPPKRRHTPDGRERDLWALGVLLFEILTLRRPFEGATPADLAAEVSAGRYPAPSSISKGFPRELERIASKLLRPFAEDRYQTALEVHEDLNRYLAGLPVRAGRSEKILRICSHLIRHWRVYLLAFLAAGLGALSLAGFIRIQEVQRQEETLLGIEREMLADPVMSDVEIQERLREQIATLCADPDLPRGLRRRAESAEWNLRTKTINQYQHSRAEALLARGTPPGKAIRDVRPASLGLLLQSLVKAAAAQKASRGDIVEEPLDLVQASGRVRVTGADEQDVRWSLVPMDLVAGPMIQGVQPLHPVNGAVTLPAGFWLLAVEVPGQGRHEFVRLLEFGETFDLDVMFRTDSEVAASTPMLRIPAGRYLVGQRDDSSDNLYRERYVELGDFLIDTYEVTCGEFYEFLRTEEDRRQSSGDAALSPPLPIPACFGERLEAYNRSMDRQPVRGVPWWLAQRYAESRGKRLPTWAEWQAAIRGPDGLLFPWGNEHDNLAALASVAGKKGEPPPEIGSSSADTSVFGVKDGYGSVPEWLCMPYVTYVEGRVYPHFGWRQRVGLGWDQTPTFPERGVTTISHAPPEALNIGFRCVRVLSKP